MFKLESLCRAEIRDLHRWNVVAGEFLTTMMKAADFPGCP
jgi:hypothetical protein